MNLATARDRVARDWLLRLTGLRMLELSQRAALRKPILEPFCAGATDPLLTVNVDCHLPLPIGLRENSASASVQHPLSLLGDSLYTTSLP